MSKKLIAVATAAALALTGLVGISPANASVVVTYGINDAAGTGVTEFTPGASAAAAAANIVVPADNKLTFTNTAARSSLAKVTVTTAVGDTVTASSTGALKILDLNSVGQIGSDYRAETTAGVDYTSASGTQTFSMVATTTSVVFYVFTTSTTAASLTVNKGGNTRIVWIKGAAGPEYNITATMPKTIPATAPATANLTAVVTDVFGNKVTSGAVISESATGAGAAITEVGYDSVAGGWTFKLHATGTGAFGVGLSFTTAPTDVTGLAVANASWFATTTAVDLTALNAQVAALTASVAALKADYNGLAAKYNKLVKKSKRVVLK
jgi:hypothetical protein